MVELAKGSLQPEVVGAISRSPKPTSLVHGVELTVTGAAAHGVGLAAATVVLAAEVLRGVNLAVAAVHGVIQRRLKRNPR